MQRRAIIFSGEFVWKQWGKVATLSEGRAPRHVVYFGLRRVLLTNRLFEMLFLLGLSRWNKRGDCYVTYEDLGINRFSPKAMWDLRRVVREEAPDMLRDWIVNEEKVGYRLAHFCEPKFEPKLLLKTLPEDLREKFLNKLKTERVVIPKE